MFSEKLILPFRKHIRIRFVEEYRLNDENYFQLLNENTVSPCPRRACLRAKQISVSSTILRHEGPFWSVLFRLSTRPSKFSNEVLHAKFDFQYFVKEMFR